MENEDNIDVTVEMYIELHAPPEHIDRGIDKLEKMFNNIYFKTDSWVGRSGSMRLRNAYEKSANTKISKHLRCLTTHLLSSNPPVIPPSFLIAFESVRQNNNINNPTITNLALFNPDKSLHKWYFWNAITNNDGLSTQMKLKVSSYFK